MRRLLVVLLLVPRLVRADAPKLSLDQVIEKAIANPKIEMAEGDAELGLGDIYVVPRGRRHRPRSPGGATVVLFEPSATSNTGDTPSHRTALRRVAGD